MNRITRRDFLGKSILGTGALLISPGAELRTASETHVAGGLPPGFQVWTIRESLTKDFQGTLRKMKQLGFESMEMCSPPGYESSGFGPLMKLSATEMKKILNGEGLICISSHYNINEFREKFDERIDFALELGLTQMVAAHPGIADPSPLDAWLRVADELNRAGEKAKERGISLVYHNHNLEFRLAEGRVVYDHLLERLDPSSVKMQFQVAVISAGYKAADYFRKYPGRFISAHLADWSAEKKSSVPIGKGSVDWKEFFNTLEIGGVRNIFVEMAPETFSESLEYLKTFQ